MDFATLLENVAEWVHANRPWRITQISNYKASGEFFHWPAAKS